MNRNFMFAEDFEDIGELMESTLPPPELVEFYRGLNNREIVWNDVISDCTISIPLYIIKWNREDRDIPVEERKPIKIWINSDGGDTNVTLVLANVIALSKTPIITIGMGRSYSSGGLLLMAGHKRLIFDSTSVLIHDGSSGAIGDVRVRDFILKHTQIPAELLDKNYRRDWFLFSEDVIKYGIADKIITDIDEVI